MHGRAPQKLLSKELNPDDTPEKILNAAAEVFAETGYHGATVRQICKRAGANIALVNYHFGDKLGLYTKVLERSVQLTKLNAMRAALESDASAEEIVRAVIKARLRGIATGAMADRQFRILLHEMAQPTPAITRVINTITRPVYERILGVIGGMIGRAPTDEKTRLCVHSIMGQVMVYFLARPLFQRLWPELKMTPEQLDRIADHIADFSLAYLRQMGRESQQRIKRPHRRSRR